MGTNPDIEGLASGTVLAENERGLTEVFFCPGVGADQTFAVWPKLVRTDYALTTWGQHYEGNKDSVYGATLPRRISDTRAAYDPPDHRPFRPILAADWVKYENEDGQFVSNHAPPQTAPGSQPRQFAGGGNSAYMDGHVDWADGPEMMAYGTWSQRKQYYQR